MMVKKAFSINLNVQHVNGMTHFNLAVHSGKLVKTRRRYAWLLDNLEYLEVDPYFLKMHFCKSLEAQFFYTYHNFELYQVPELSQIHGSFYSIWLLATELRRI